MQYASAILVAAFAATHICAHGVVTQVKGANGVNMAALSVIDGTPRDCPTPACGSEADTSIIRNNELGTARASALGRTQGGGPVDAAKMVQAFMDGAASNTTQAVAARALHEAAMAARARVLPRAAAGGARTAKGAVETGVKAAAGAGAAQGLPTANSDGTVDLVYHQVNQDGAGPCTAEIDSTSGGSDPKAFKTATVTKNVPGLGIGGLSAAQTMDFNVAVQVPAGTVCSGTVGGATNVCIVRMRNNAATGPFGGSAAFTQSPTARKRAIEYNLARKRFAHALTTKL